MLFQPFDGPMFGKSNIQVFALRGFRLEIAKQVSLPGKYIGQVFQVNPGCPKQIPIVLKQMSVSIRYKSPSFQTSKQNPSGCIPYFYHHVPKWKVTIRCFLLKNQLNHHFSVIKYPPCHIHF